MLLVVLGPALLQGVTGAAHEGGANLLRLDREVSGLLDSYLEAVPECPAREDTPIRIWLLDLAWTRASAARLTIGSPVDAIGDSSMSAAFKEYLAACDRYLEAYGRVREFYHGAGRSDSALSAALEDDLIIADSAWLESGARLFGMLGEED